MQILIHWNAGWSRASLYFSELGDGEFFKVVRSATPPGEPVELIATRRPYEDPGVERVYYRFCRDHSTILDKAHMPYALDDKRLAWLDKLFLEPRNTPWRLCHPMSRSRPPIALSPLV
jgi:hypothetical protein